MRRKGSFFKCVKEDHELVGTIKDTLPVSHSS